MNHTELIRKFEKSGQKFEHESLVTKDGHDLTILFFSHATLGLVWDDTVVYVDPLTEYADYTKMPKADMVLVTHEHYDHYDSKAVDAAAGEKTLVISSTEVGRQYYSAKVLRPGESYTVSSDIHIEAVAAYNTSESQLQFHPKERGDNGYVLQLGLTRIYIAGDTEPTDEMKALKNIDIMFLPVNQPYTMTLEQAVEAAKAVRAPIFYPYHTTDTEIDRIKAMLADAPSISVRIYPMQ